jgi:lysophospholipase L1-like esterase
VLTLLALALAQPPEVAPPPRPVGPFAKWEKDVSAIEKKLKANAPKAGAVFFAGSSSIVKWDLGKSFPKAGHVSVGFGGSVIADTAHFAPRLFGPHKPATVVFYAGDNDIGRGNKPEQVLADFKRVVAELSKLNPECRILFISIKPSVARWKLYDEQTKANALVRDYCDKTRGLVYVDIVPLMLRADGTPNPELFVKDGLHLSEKGYELWTAAVNKALKTP